MEVKTNQKLGLWAYSKGDAYRDIRVVLTDSKDHLLEDTKIAPNTYAEHKRQQKVTESRFMRFGHFSY
jgi:hypothetical protein